MPETELHENTAAPIDKLTTTASERARINGAKSRGPATPEGRERSSRNAMKHGLTSNLVLVKEEADDFADVLLMWEDHFKPATPIEAGLVYRIAAAEFRAARAITMQTNLLDYETDTRAGKLLEHWPTLDTAGLVSVAFRDALNESRAFDSLRRYETGFERTSARAIKSLLDLQAKRLAGEKAA